MSPTLLPKYGYLYIADLSPRFGTESGKPRPVLVLQTDLLNEALHPSTWVFPCTTNLSGDSLLRVLLPRGIASNSKDCEVMIDQSRSIDNSRFKKLLGPLPRSVLAEVKEKFRSFAEL